MKKLFILLAFLSTSLHAYELLMVQAVSNTGKTFLTKIGKEEGIFVGKKGTFTSNNTSIIATAINVTREQTLWRIDNEITTVPFKNGEVVTYNSAVEHLWALSPDEMRNKYAKSFVPERKLSFDFGFAINKTLNESVSGVEDRNTNRTGYQFDFGFTKDLKEEISLSFYLRYAQENTTDAVATVKNQRFMGILEPRYYFPRIKSFKDSRFFSGLSVGFGKSQTSVPGLSTSGQALLLPGVKLGLEIPTKKDWRVMLDASFESLSTDENLERGKTQKTTFTNFKTGLMLGRNL